MRSATAIEDLTLGWRGVGGLFLGATFLGFVTRGCLRMEVLGLGDFLVPFLVGLVVFLSLGFGLEARLAL